MTTSLSSLKCSPSLSQIGASCLQWPHHGASTRGGRKEDKHKWCNYLQNSTNTCLDSSKATSLKFFPTRTFTGLASQSSGTSSVFKWGYRKYNKNISSFFSSSCHHTTTTWLHSFHFTYSQCSIKEALCKSSQLIRVNLGEVRLILLHVVT